MDNAPQLRAEDRPEFERVLSEALYAERVREALHRVSDVLSLEELRNSALRNTAAIAAGAGAEYGEYVAARERVRRSPDGPDDPFEGGFEDGFEDDEETPGGRGGPRPLSAMLSGPNGKPAGVVPVMIVLTPVLSGAAAVIFLVVGYVMGMVDPEPPLANSMRTAGWLFAAISLGSVVISMIALLVTALRHSSATRHESPLGQAELADAKARWRTALHRNGIEPFLNRQIGLAEEVIERTRATGAAVAEEEEPGRLGYSSPGFSTAPEPFDEERYRAGGRSASARVRRGSAAAAAAEPAPETTGRQRGPAAGRDDDLLESRTSRMMRRLGLPQLPRKPRRRND